MHEMLGNQYFMTRNYLGAAEVFANVLKEDPNNLNAKKKMIVSLTQIGKYEKAAQLFTELISDNPDLIINTDPVKDDCPCYELVDRLEDITKLNDESFTTLQTLGILWLYCDINKSVNYFRKAKELKPTDKNINTVLNILEKKLQEIH